MNANLNLSQEPTPGSRQLVYSGDTLTLRLTLDRPVPGRAWIRTNLGYAAITRREIIRQVDLGEPLLGRDWFDTPRACVDPQTFQARLPACEVGQFEAKCFFLIEGHSRPVWPAGENLRIKVEPAYTCGANIVYNAFVRQFGPNRKGRFKPPADEKLIGELDTAGYAVIPPSGTFRDLIGELDLIIGELGCRFILLLPIHPTPTTYGRMGRFGSPYAALSFSAVDPALAVFDPAVTPLEQFAELVDAVHLRGAGILIDVAINHTGWAAGLHESHPRWLARDAQGQIEVPGAWGVRWEDLTKLDYSHKDLWQYMADVFLLWCRRGVDGFRCDAGYMIPMAAWTYIIARVREQFPDTVFLLEGLGGKVSVTRALLGRAGFNWAYSELFQNYDRSQIEHYLPLAMDISGHDGVTVHFAETHDNPRLAARSTGYARMRTALCALTSVQGAFGFANGVEWFATEKIDVHDANSLNWGAQTNQVAHIRQLNRLLRNHPAFDHRCRPQMIQNGDGNQIVLLRQHPDAEASLLVAANLDPDQSNTAGWPTERFAAHPDHCLYDLLSTVQIAVSDHAGVSRVSLAPGQILCLTRSQEQFQRYAEPISGFDRLDPQTVLRQRLRSKVLEVIRVVHDTGDLGDVDLDEAAVALCADPWGFCTRMHTARDQAPRMITWQWPRDERRVVMIPPKHFLLVRSGTAFRARIAYGDVDNETTLSTENSLPADDGTWFVLFTPALPANDSRRCTLKLVLHQNHSSRHVDAPLLYLADAESLRIRQVFDRSALGKPDRLFLAANEGGALLRAGVSWGLLNSRYDCLLSAGRSQGQPDDRWNYLARCRAWVVYQGYSQVVGDDCLESFRYRPDAKAGVWHFHIPTGQGETIALTITVSLATDRNALRMHFFRHPRRSFSGRLSDNSPVRLIVRPDIEYRNFHETTKAYLGPEQHWPAAITVVDTGFRFDPEAGYRLQLEASEGTFIHEPEWQYMVHRSLEAERGLDPNSDLFSPGYFSISLDGNQSESLEALVTSHADASAEKPVVYGEPADILSTAETAAPLDALLHSVQDFVVDREPLKTVIAGYPWFLDWGRDALIFTRGLIAAGKTEAARDILLQFGRFEKGGTLPNMIRGDNTDNRDTSDAPLWFVTACRDLVDFENNRSFLEAPAGDRTIGRILTDIGAALMDGTANGIKMDSESGLLYSPAHFTWMDTDHPAGTPRQGYPIEIQALWFAALQWLGQMAPGSQRPWQAVSQQVKESIRQHYYRPEDGYLSDCLHADAGRHAGQAKADDALRPNQLFALTMGAVDDPAIARSIVDSCTALLVPGALRSLSDRPVKYPLAIEHNGQPLNDPFHPYQGTYRGDEDTRRKPAYHNGTAWCWLLPSFCEAWWMTYGPSSRAAVRAWLGSALNHMNDDCLGHIPEIQDGNAPHTPRGCDAQAWSVSELLRVWLLTQN